MKHLPAIQAHKRGNHESFHGLPVLDIPTDKNQQVQNREPISYNEAHRLFGLWLAGFASENTRRAYQREIKTFAKFTGHADPVNALCHFLALGDGPAHTIADAWRAAKIEAGQSPATINRSMASLNSLMAAAKRQGLTTVRLEAKGMKSKPYRDTSGPGTDGIDAMLKIAKGQRDSRKSARDVAIIRLLFGMGLRRAEVTELNISHFDPSGERPKLSIKGKGRQEREILTVPQNAAEALKAWLAVRGTDDDADPLFVNMARNGSGGKRITGSGLYHLIAYVLGKKAGIKTRPHGLRHTAVTKALDVFNGDYRKARSFSRHASLNTVRLYDDNRADHGGQVAQAVDALID